MNRYAVKEILKEHKGKKYIFPIGVLSENVEEDENHRFLTDEEKRILMDKPGKGDPVSDSTVTFDPEPTERALLQSGAKLRNLFPSINAWLRALKNVAFTGKYTDLFGTPMLGNASGCEVTERKDITVQGYVADARAVKDVNDKFGDMSLERDGNDVYAVYKDGADTVRKKLGSGGMECLVDALGAKATKDVEDQSQDVEVYGFCVQYDLTIFQGYQDMVIGVGGNTLIAVAAGASGQQYTYPATPFLCNQANFEGTIDMRNVNYWQLIKYAECLPNGNANGEILKCNADTNWEIISHPAYDYPVTYVRHPNFMLYNPVTGQLYHITQATIHSTTISVYKIV